MLYNSHAVINIPLANWLFAIIFFLVLFVGGVLQTASAGWGLLATELLFILAPVLLILRVLNTPLRKGLNLNPLSRQHAIWSLLSGFGLGLFSQWLLSMIAALLGYTLPVLPQLYPRDVADGLVLLFGLLVAAPVCEEVLFRGAIMGAYRRLGVWTAILISALLFAIFHGSLQRFLVLIPLAVLAGYMAWRLQSLVGSILLHTGYNIPGSLVIVLSGMGGLKGPAASTLSLLPWIGLGLAAAGITILHRGSKPELIEPAPEPREALSFGFRSFSAYLPFILALPMFLLPAASEVISGRYPDRLAEPAPTFLAERWSVPQESHYELRNILNQPVGQAVCALNIAGEVYSLECKAERVAFEAQVPGSYFNMDSSMKRWWVDWSSAGQVTAYESEEILGDDRRVMLRLDLDSTSPMLRINRTGEAEQTLTMGSVGLLPDEWPWRLQGLPSGYPYRANADFARPAWWSQELQQSIPFVQPVVIDVVSAEPVETPGGRVICWKVRVGDLTAYYSVDAPHRLIRYDDGIVSYLALDAR